MDRNFDSDLQRQLDELSKLSNYNDALDRSNSDLQKEEAERNSPYKKPVFNPFVFTDPKDTRPGTVELGAGISVTPTEWGSAFIRNARTGGGFVIDAAEDAVIGFNKAIGSTDADTLEAEKNLRRYDYEKTTQQFKPSELYEEGSRNVTNAKGILGKTWAILKNPRYTSTALVGGATMTVPAVASAALGAPLGGVAALGAMGATVLGQSGYNTRNSLFNQEVERRKELSPDRRLTEVIKDVENDPVFMGKTNKTALSVGVAHGALATVGGIAAGKAADFVGAASGKVFSKFSTGPKYIADDAAESAVKRAMTAIGVDVESEAGKKAVSAYSKVLANNPARFTNRKVGVGADSKPLFDDNEIASQYILKVAGSEFTNLFGPKAISLLTEVPAQIGVGATMDAVTQYETTGKVDWNQALTNGITFAPMAAISSRAVTTSKNHYADLELNAALKKSKAIQEQIASRPKLSSAQAKEYVNSLELLRETDSTLPDNEYMAALKIGKLARSYKIGQDTAQEEYDAAVKAYEDRKINGKLNTVIDRISAIMDGKLKVYGDEGIDVKEFTPEETAAYYEEVRKQLETEAEKRYFDELLGENPEKFDMENLHNAIARAEILPEASEETKALLKEDIKVEDQKKADIVSEIRKAYQRAAEEEQTDSPNISTVYKNLGIEMELADFQRTLVEQGKDGSLILFKGDEAIASEDSTTAALRTKNNDNGKPIELQRMKLTEKFEADPDAPVLRKEEAQPTLTDHILQAGVRITNGKPSGSRVPLSELDKELTGLSRKERDAHLLQMQRDGDIVVMRNDNPRDITETDAASALDVGNGPHHFFYFTKQGLAKLTEGKNKSKLIRDAYDEVVTEMGHHGVTLGSVYEKLRGKMTLNEFKEELTRPENRDKRTLSVGDWSLATEGERAAGIDLSTRIDETSSAEEVAYYAQDIADNAMAGSKTDSRSLDDVYRRIQEEENRKKALGPEYSKSISRRHFDNMIQEAADKGLIKVEDGRILKGDRDMMNPLPMESSHDTGIQLRLTLDDSFGKPLDNESKALSDIINAEERPLSDAELLEARKNLPTNYENWGPQKRSYARRLKSLAKAVDEIVLADPYKSGELKEAADTVETVDAQDVFGQPKLFDENGKTTAERIVDEVLAEPHVELTKEDYAAVKDSVINGIKKNLMEAYAKEEGWNWEVTEDSFTPHELKEFDQRARETFEKRYGEKYFPPEEHVGYEPESLLDKVDDRTIAMLNAINSFSRSQIANLSDKKVDELLVAKDALLFPNSKKGNRELIKNIVNREAAQLSKRGVTLEYYDGYSDLPKEYKREKLQGAAIGFYDRNAEGGIRVIIIGKAVEGYANGSKFSNISRSRTDSSGKTSIDIKASWGAKLGAAIRETVFHEVVGHHGLENLFQIVSGRKGMEAFNNFILRQVKVGGLDMEKAVKEIVYDRGYRYGELRSTDKNTDPKNIELVVKYPRGTSSKQQYLHMTKTEVLRTSYEYFAKRAEKFGRQMDQDILSKADATFLSRSRAVMDHIFGYSDWRSTHKKLTDHDLQLLLDDSYRYFWGEDAKTGTDMSRISVAAYIKTHGQKAFKDALLNDENMQYFGPIADYISKLSIEYGKKYSQVISHQVQEKAGKPAAPLTMFDRMVGAIKEFVKPNSRDPLSAYSKDADIQEMSLAPQNPIQKKLAITQEDREIAQTAKAIELTQSGFGSLNKSKLVEFADNIKRKIDESGVLHRFQALGRLNKKEVYDHLSNVANGLEIKTDFQSRALQKSLLKLDSKQNFAVMQYYRTKEADPNILSSVGIKRDVIKQITVAKKTIEELGQTLVDMGVLRKEVYEKNKGSYLTTMYFDYLGQFKPTGKKLSFMGYLKKNGQLPVERKVSKGQIESAAVIVPDVISTIGRDVAIMRFTDSLLQMDTDKGLGWILGNKNLFPTGEFYPDKTTKDGKVIKGEEIKFTDNQLEEEIHKIETLLKDGYLGDGKGGGLFNGRDATQHKYLQDKVERFKKGLEQLQEMHKEEIKELLLKQGIPPNKITDEQVNRFKEANYKKMPVGYEWGKLSGKWVQKGVYDDYVDALDIAVNGNALAEAIFSSHGSVQKAHNYWKAKNVMLNAPVSTVRNFLQNLISMDLSTKTNILSLSKMVTEEFLLAAKGKGSRYWEYGKTYGLHASTQASAELRSLQMRHIYALERKLKMVDQEKTVLGLVKGNFHKAQDLAIATFDAASRLYGMQESLFKTVKLRDYVETWEAENKISIERLSPEKKQAVLLKAAEEANRVLFDYNRVPQWVKALRRIPIAGSPFVTFTYKAGPVSVENFVKHPTKHLKYLLLGTILQQWAMSNYGWSEKEMDDYVENVGKTIDVKGTMYVLPFKDNKGRPQVADLRYLFPWSDWYGAGRSIYKSTEKDGIAGFASGIGRAAIDNFGLFGGPLNEMVYATSGRHMFMDKPIIEETSVTATEKLNDLMRWQTSMWMPPWMTSYGALGHAMDYMGFEATPFNAGAEYRKQNYSGDTPGQIASRLLGTNVYGRTNDELIATRMKKYNFEKRQLMAKKAAIMKSTLPDKINRLREVNEMIKELGKNK